MNEFGIAWAWDIFHKGEKASKDEMRRALLAALKAHKSASDRLEYISPIVDPIESMVSKMIEERLGEIRL